MCLPLTCQAWYRECSKKNLKALKLSNVVVSDPILKAQSILFEAWVRWAPVFLIIAPFS